MDRGIMNYRLMATMFLLTCSPLSSLTTPVSANILRMDQIAADAAPAKRTMVFVHGAGHGAWCWYQVVTMMQAAGFNTVTLDLTSAGLDRTPADNVMTISQYAKPLTDFLSDRSSSEPKVVLVGHSLGGVSVSYAMEAHPDKVDKAIFLSALMPQHGETPLEVIGPYFAALLQVGLFKPQQADGSSSPTSVAVNRTVAPSFFYNQSPAEQINLALSLLDDTPLSVFDEVMTLTPKRYGSISRYYILCGMDKTVPFNVQVNITTRNPPVQKFYLKDSDHSAFFSAVPYLVTLLKNIARLK
ncbi:hypothetical protein MPTK1_2g26010 [Marchantia polymorpha subsp. ruderalis]|uniref:AB hydrolase-1 domain-containing protein n=1 Tax=Marchantia polymorpha TaxID=3197 RepID=A0A2R6XBC5_MARPO|nr:hypothetical protein MARPO_0025s0077 [Marchantia polymorpha]BBN03745.1 hypothetical protein Mp_2g26010 [Marchantia polymorpha subsp. ruderalis]|eukprot:PTQ43387.1 hypothetical protein MARPO_0025s0077 [Marchantia polymorpha]